MEINREIYKTGILFDSKFLIIELLEGNKLIYKTKMYDSNGDYSEQKTSILKNNEFILEHCEGHLCNERIITLETVHQLHSLSNKN